MYFDKAVSLVLTHEGYFSDDKSDPGGPTIYGLSHRFLISSIKLGEIDLAYLDADKDGSITAGDLALVNLPKAINIYRVNFWDKYNFGLIDKKDIAIKLFDMSIAMGPPTAIKLMQRAINDLNIGRRDTLLIVDGILGKNTADAINRGTSALRLGKFQEFCVAYFLALVAKSKALEKYFKGWRTRVYDM